MLTKIVENEDKKCRITYSIVIIDLSLAVEVHKNLILEPTYIYKATYKRVNND